MDEFYGRLAETLDADEAIVQDTVLDTLEMWDSLGALAVTAMIDETYSVTISAEDLKRAETAGDLCELVRQRRSP